MMNINSQTTNALGAGTLGYKFLPKLLQATDQLGVTGRTFLTVGAAEFNRAVVEGHTQRLDRPGVRDVSPSNAEIAAAIGFTGSDFVAEQLREVWESVVCGVVDRVVQQTLRSRVAGSQTLWVQGMRTGHGKPAELLLRRLKERIPDQFIVAKSVLPEDGDQRPLAATGFDLFRRLKDDGVVAVTLLTDNDSPFAKRRTLAVQDDYEATALASFVGGLAQFAKNRAFGELGQRLGEWSSFAGWTFASQPLVPVYEGMGRRILRTFGAGPARYDIADVGHLVRVAQLTTEQALADPDARALAEPVDQTVPYYIVYTLPVPADATGAWQQFSNQVRRWLSNSYPLAVPLFTAGQGTPDSRATGRSWLQASVLYPLPSLPAPIALVLSGPSRDRVMRPRLLPASVDALPDLPPQDAVPAATRLPAYIPA
jgi:hypothetical protein